MIARHRFALGALVALASCHGHGSKLDQLAAPSQASRAHGPAAAKDTDGPPAHLPLTAAEVAPILHELGAPGRMPTSIVVELARPVVDADAVGGAGEKTVLQITPELPGRLAFTKPSELVFTPALGFAANTTYKVALKSIETPDGVLHAPAGQWTYTFKTPAFHVVGWAPNRTELKAHAVMMRIAFSAPVLPNLARDAMTFTADGHPLKVLAAPADSPASVSALLADPHLVAGAKLEVAIKAGLRSTQGATAPAAKLTYTVPSAAAMAILGTELVEGASGYYLDVHCSNQLWSPLGDAEAPNPCQLGPDAASHFHFTPAVDHVYATTGRDGFRIFGDFKRGAYALHVDDGLRSTAGASLASAYDDAFAVSTRRPQLRFLGSGRYLPRNAWDNLGFRHLNVDAVNLVVRQIPPENLVFWMSGDSDAADVRTSNVILRKTIPLRGDPDVETTSWLDVGSLIPTTKGVLEISLVGIGAKTTSRLLLTNLSLVAKKWSDPAAPWHQTVRAWALDIDSAKPRAGVEISLLRESGKVVARCTTSGDGGCTLSSDDPRDPDHAVPFALVAKQGDDLTYLRYADLRADVAESSTSGAPYVADSPYHVAMFSDRGVYRPGETAHVVAIVRDAKDRAPDAGLPVEVKITDPRAKLVRKLTAATNAAGELAIDHALPQFADTGHWQVSLSVGGEPLGRYDLQVEEFVPERMKVTVAAAHQDALSGAPLAFDVAARYLFGGSAMDSGVEMTCTVAPAAFAPKHNADLVYGVAAPAKAVTLGTAKGQLDPAGKLTLACPADGAATSFAQTGELTANVSVLEAGSGRATVESATMTVHPEKFYLGLKTPATEATPGEAFAVDGTVVDWNGDPLASAVEQVQIQLLHQDADYNYGYDENTGEERYDRWLREVPEGRQTAKVVNGHFHFEVTPGVVDDGFVVRVTAGKARTDLVLAGEGYDDYGEYGDGEGRSDLTPRPARATQLALELPKEIEVGKPVTVKVKAPYRGRVLWTVETDHLLTAAWKDAARGELAWSFTLPKFAPNVYVSAFLIKDPHAESKQAFLPDRAYGVASTRVKPTAFAQQVVLTAPKQVRSQSPLSVTVDVGKPDGPTFAVVSVVDEGILQLTKFKTPDPLAELLPKHELDVETYETIGWTMLHKPADPSARTGGGDDEDEAQADDGKLGKSRVQPVHPVALFSGVLPVPADGKLTIPFHVPTYRGQLRVMAITASATRVGRAEAEVTVRDPLVVEPTFPRFLAQHDQLDIPVFLTNLSGGPLDVAVELGATDLPVPGLTPRKDAAPLAFDKTTATVHLDDGRSETVVFRARTLAAVGGAKLRVVAHARGRAGAFDVSDEQDVPLLPAGPKDRVVQKLQIAPGTTSIDLAKLPALHGWAPTSETATFWLTTNPYAEAFEHLSYLLHYPYGCIEQTTSTVFPLLYLGNVIDTVDPQLAQLKIEDMVAAGIDRVLSMETPSGGFGYWPGETQPLEWATAYATHMLIEAKKAGYAVPQARLDGVLKWIEGRVAAYERGEHVARDRWNPYDQQAEAYLQYVLALAGRGHKARMLALISKIPASATGADAEDRYLLEAGLYIAGDRRFAKDLRHPDTSPIKPQRSNDWSFYSDLRRRGMMLSTFHDLFGHDPAGEPLAQRVAEGLSNDSSGYTTQELVWGIMGLGKWVGAPKGTSADVGTLTADGETIAPRRTPGKDRTWSVMRASEYGSLSLALPASASGLWLVVNSSGVRADGAYKTGGSGLALTRTYRDLDGNPVDPAAGTLKLGDLVYVELDLKNTSGEAIQNIALVDRLPAGFEIENARLGRGTLPDWVQQDEQWDLDFMNLRDDRVEAFGTVGAGQTRKLVYTLRAVTSGTFAMPPAEAGAMYDPTLWARDRGGTAVIGGPWTAKTL